MHFLQQNLDARDAAIWSATLLHASPDINFVHAYSWSVYSASASVLLRFWRRKNGRSLYNATVYSVPVNIVSRKRGALFITEHRSLKVVRTVTIICCTQSITSLGCCQNSFHKKIARFRSRKFTAHAKVWPERI